MAVLRNPTNNDAVRFLRREAIKGRLEDLHICIERDGGVIFADSLKSFVTEGLCIRDDLKKYTVEAESEGSLPELYYERLLVSGGTYVMCFAGFQYSIGLARFVPVVRDATLFVIDILTQLTISMNLSLVSLFCGLEDIDVPAWREYDCSMYDGIFPDFVSIYESSKGTRGIPATETGRLSVVNRTEAAIAEPRYYADGNIAYALLAEKLAGPPLPLPCRDVIWCCGDKAGYDALLPMNRHSLTAESYLGSSYRELAITADGNIINITDFSDIFMYSMMTDEDVADHRERVAQRYSSASRVPFYGVDDFTMRCELLNMVVLNHRTSSGYVNIIPDTVTASQARSLCTVQSLVKGGARHLIANNKMQVFPYFIELSRSGNFDMYLMNGRVAGRTQTRYLYVCYDLLTRRDREAVFGTLVDSSSDLLIHCIAPGSSESEDGAAIVADGLLPRRQSHPAW